LYVESLITKAIASGFYDVDLIEYLRERSELLTISVRDSFLDNRPNFLSLDFTDVPVIVSQINADMLLASDHSFLPKQIIKLISLLFLTNKISMAEYIKILLNFAAGKGLTENTKDLMKQLINLYSIIFSLSFFDEF
jgi:hypothetical protein